MNNCPVSKKFATSESIVQFIGRSVERDVVLLPHKVSFEPYMKAFQYKVLNSILFTNTKLCCNRKPLTTFSSSADMHGIFGRNLNGIIIH